MTLIPSFTEGVGVAPEAKRAYTPRVNGGGNYCGHIPEYPRFNLAKPFKTGEGGLPRILSLAVERFQSPYYYNPISTCAPLNDTNNSNRKMRSERREACVLLIAAIFKYLDIASLRVGIPSKNGFLNLTYKILADHTGLSFSRTERAAIALKKAGILNVTQVCNKNKDGTYKGLAAVKNVSKEFFTSIGLKAMLELERKKASKRLKKKEEAWKQADEKEMSLAKKAKLRMFMKGAVEGIQQAINAEEKAEMRKLRQRQPTGPPRYTEEEKAKIHRVYTRAFELRQENPDWDVEKCKKIAEEEDNQKHG